MRSACLTDMIKLAKSSKSSFAQAVNNAQEIGVVVPSILKANLEKLNFKVQETKRNVLTCVEVLDGEKVVAFGLSHDAGDALLQAIYAELK